MSRTLVLVLLVGALLVPVVAGQSTAISGVGVGLPADMNLVISDGTPENRSVFNQGLISMSVSTTGDVQVVEVEFTPTCGANVCVPIRKALQGANGNWNLGAGIKLYDSGFLATTYTTAVFAYGTGFATATGQNFTVLAGRDTTTPVLTVPSTSSSEAYLVPQQRMLFSVTDDTTLYVEYSVGKFPLAKLSPPYVIPAERFHEGEQNVVIRAFDRALHLGGVSFKAFVDGSAPELELLNLTLIEDVPATIAVRTYDLTPTSYQLKITQAGTNQSLLQNGTFRDDTVLTPSFVPRGLGNVTLRVNATDSLGHVSQIVREIPVQVRDVVANATLFKMNGIKITGENQSFNVTMKQVGGVLAEPYHLELWIDSEFAAGFDAIVPQNGSTNLTFEHPLYRGLRQVELRVSHEQETVNGTIKTKVFTIDVPIGRVLVGEHEFLILVNSVGIPIHALDGKDKIKLEARQFEDRFAYFFEFEGNEYYWDVLFPTTSFDAPEPKEDGKKKSPGFEPILLVGLLGLLALARRRKSD